MTQLLGGDPHKDNAARFHWKLLSALWNYAADCLPEIADDAASVDRAMRAGFNWEMGPFQLWDAAGVRQTVGAHEGRRRTSERCTSSGCSPPAPAPGTGITAGSASISPAATISPWPKPRASRGWRISARPTAWFGKTPARRSSIWAMASAAWNSTRKKNASAKTSSAWLTETLRADSDAVRNFDGFRDQRRCG